jgi:4-amino-4-deoxy-L-arabinose transferase-like glycosyltransferase
MNEGSSRIHSPKGWPCAFLVGFCLVLYFVNLGQWDLWNPDEPRYGQVAREMVERNDPILMHQDGQMYSDKPPLFFWLIALSSFLLKGFSSFAVRAPSALFGTFTVLLTFFLGRRLYNWRTGFFSALILATTGEFAYLSTRANMDTTLTFFTTAALFCFIESSVSSAQSDQISWYRKLLPYGFYVSMAMATLTKGPVGFVLPFMVCLVYLVIQRNWKGLRNMKLLAGTLLFFGIVLAWYIPAVLAGGKVYLQETLFKHTVERFAKGWNHVHPIYYYFFNFPMNFLPWFLFLPAALVHGFSRERVGKRKESLFLFVWFATIFVFFSLSKGKRAIYLLPLYPAASVMVGALWHDFVNDRALSLRGGWISIPLYILSGTLFIGGVAVPWVLSMKFPSYLGYGFPVMAFLILGGLGLFFLYRLNYRRAALWLIIGIVTVGFFYTQRVVFPLVNPYKSARYLSEEILARIQPGERLGIYGGSSAAFNFYTGIVPIVEMERGEDMFQFLRSPGRVFCLIEARSFDAFQKMQGMPKVEEILRRSVGDGAYVLVSNR